ncbi:MAG: CDP-alcohol phosphatidyltransferase family protein [Anaerolineaceae bacterium]|nr:CDP-alcohol phosphatidyltransferase family protein [Anaerolineaceae bacterium]
MSENRKITFTEKCRKWFKGFGDKAAAFLLKIGLTANAVTIIGCLGHIGACWLAYKGKFAWAGLLLIVFAVFDFFDGTMSRMVTNGKGTKFGAVLDSTTDRYAEFMIFGGILMYYAKHGQMVWVAVCIVAMMGAFLVPYTRAKGEIYGLDMRLGIMSRLERYIVLVACLLIGFPNIAMAVIAVFANITAIQRLVHMKKNLD